MALASSWWKLGAGLAVIATLYAFQRPFRLYDSMEPYDDIPLPPDWRVPAEWIQARLMYPPHPTARFGTRVSLRRRP